MVKKYCSGPFFTNTYLVNSGNNAVIIDPGMGFEKYAQDIIDNYNVVGVLITHAHIDHIDTMNLFNCPIYIYKDEALLLADETKSLYNMMNKHMKFDINKLDIKYVNDLDEIILGDFKFLVYHTPGHTKGSCCYLYKNNLFSGDTLFRLSVGRTDFPTGDVAKLHSSLKRLVNVCKNDIVVYPGHDEQTTIGFEKENNMFVKIALR